MPMNSTCKIVAIFEYDLFFEITFYIQIPSQPTKLLQAIKLKLRQLTTNLMKANYPHNTSR